MKKIASILFWFFLIGCGLAGIARAEFTVNDVAGFNVNSKAPSSGAFVSCTGNTTSPASYTFTAHATGTAGNRWTAVVFGGRDGTTDWSTTSATLDGNAMAEVADTANASSLVETSIYIIANPTGTTATIVVTPSESIATAFICVFALYDLNSATAFDIATNFDTAGAAIDLSVDNPSGCVAIGAATSQTNSITHTWTGLTEQSDQFSGDAEASFTSAGSSTAGVPLSITVDPTGTNDVAGASASFC